MLLFRLNHSQLNVVYRMALLCEIRADAFSWYLIVRLSARIGLNDLLQEYLLQ